jgi:uncharacterized protein
MASGKLPAFIEPFRLAEQHGTIEGQTDLAGMARLTSLLASDQGTCDVALQFDVDAQRIRHVSGTIRGQLTMTCQRCLQPMTLAVESTVSLALVRTDGELDRLPEGYEPAMVPEDKLKLKDLIEEELILNLPAVALHDSGSCKRPASVADESGPDTEEEDRENPFSVLAQLKRQQ